jgi:hypothetical protein
MCVAAEPTMWFRGQRCPPIDPQQLTLLLLFGNR